MAQDNQNPVAVIMVGGSGTRLWPLSRADYPKQFVDFFQGLSLFQLTVKRMMVCFSIKDIYILTTEAYHDTINNQIDFISSLKKNYKDILKANLIIEPCPRSTAPAVALALKFLKDKRGLDDQRVVCVFPCDHAIEPVSKFTLALKKMFAAARTEKIVTMGIKPNCPHTGYGYIKVKGKFLGGYLVERFTEKPALAQARRLIQERALWNGGMFAFSSGLFMSELKQYRPDIAAYFDLPYDALLKKFKDVPKESIDYAVMEKTDKAVTIKLDAAYSDLGSWDSFVEFAASGKGNQAMGRAEFLESENNFVYSHQRTAALIGVRDLIVIDTSDALLIVKKGQSNKVKGMVEHFQAKESPLAREGLKVYRRWGYYVVLQEEPGFKVKKIAVYPGKGISLQTHTHRSEHWNIVEGTALVTIGARQAKVKKNQSVYVGKNVKHRLHNPGTKPLVIIETQIGKYLGEDDIKRYAF